MSLDLDNRTVILVLGGLYLFVPLTVWLVLRMPRQRAPVLWCGGGMMGGLGFVLMGSRGFISDHLSYLLGQPMLVAAAMLTAQSLRQDLNRLWPWRWIWGLVGAYGLLLWGVLPRIDVPALGMLIRAANMSALVTVVASAWAVGRAENSRNAKTIAAAYTVQVLAIVMNLYVAWRGSNDIHTIQGGTLTVVSYMVMLFVALTVGLSYLGLNLERQARSSEDLIRNATRITYWHQKRDALVQLERERTLVVLADSMGHTLTQPLTAGLLHLQVMERQLDRQPGIDPLPAETVGRQLEQVIDCLQTTSKNIERIRGLVKPVPTQSVRLNLIEVLHDVERLLRQEAINQAIELQFDPMPQDLWMMGDSLQLLQALLQVLRNALAAAAQSPIKKVQVCLRCTNDALQIEVQDSGPGFSATFLNNGIDQLPQQYSLEGIGLFVVKAILQHHHGKILLNNSPAGGAKVTLILPRLPSVESAALT